eukprot:293685-Karenia_brevis.AAC.1
MIEGPAVKEYDKVEHEFEHEKLKWIEQGAPAGPSVPLASPAGKRPADEVEQSAAKKVRTEEQKKKEEKEEAEKLYGNLDNLW